MPTAGDTPAMPAASSLECLSEIAFQNGPRSDRCNKGGRPGERSFARRDRSDFNFSWFNNHRLLEPIGYIPPAEAEANYWKQNAPASATASTARTAAQQEG